MDDMGYSDLSCYGESRWTTSHIDSLAANGIRFTDCYSASAISSPSRAGLLTGRYPGRMGIQAVFYPDSYTGLAPEETTIAEVLKSRGYATSYIGKWHVGSRERFLPLNQGFDSYLGIPYSNDMSAQVLLRGNDVEEFHIDIDNLTKKYTREAVQFIESSGKNRFRPSSVRRRAAPTRGKERRDAPSEARYAAGTVPPSRRSREESVCRR